MGADGICPNRRRFLQRLAILGGAWLTTPGLFAEELADAAQRKLIITPGMTEGPFYPDKMPLDTDNDLLILNDGITPAVGEVSYVSGRVLTASGSRSAMVSWKSGSATPMAPIDIAGGKIRTAATIRISRGMDAL